MSGRPGTASGARGGARPTATPLNPFGLDGGGRASDADARDPLVDSLAKAESLLGRYAGDGGSTARPGTARPGTARPGTARPGTARPGTARRGVPTGSITPPAARNAQPEVLVLDSAPDDARRASFAEDGETETSETSETSFDVRDASVSFPERDDDQTATASFSVELDASVDDASISFGGAAGASVAEEDVSFGDDKSSGDAADVRAASPPRSWGDVASVASVASVARPGTAVGGARPVSAKGQLRPVSAPRSDPAFAKSAMATTIRRSGGGGGGTSLGALSAGSAAPWAGAFDGSALETTAEADASTSMLYDENEDFFREPSTLEETSGAAIEGAADDDDELNAEVVEEDDAPGDFADARPRPSPAGSPSLEKSPAQLDAEEDTEALHGRLASVARGPAPIAVAAASPPASPKRASLSPRSLSRSPRLSGSPAARRAEAETRALHRTLSGNDPTAALKSEIAKKLNSPPPPLPAALPPVSPRGGARRPSARAPDAGYESSSADEVATEGEPTPLAKPPRASAPRSPAGRPASPPSRASHPREPTPPPSPRGVLKRNADERQPSSSDEEESFLLDAIRAARRGGAPLDARAAAMLAGLVPGNNPAPSAGKNPASGVTAPLESPEAARGARRAFEYATTPALSFGPPPLDSPPPRGGESFFSSGAAAAEARALARDDARREEAALASAAVGATGRDDWWAFLGGRGAYPGARPDAAKKRVAKEAAAPELAWAETLRSRSFDGAMRARVASLRVRLRACVAKAETSRYAAESAESFSRPGTHTEVLRRGSLPPTATAP